MLVEPRYHAPGQKSLISRKYCDRLLWYFVTDALLLLAPEFGLLQDSIGQAARYSAWDPSFMNIYSRIIPWILRLRMVN